jgi:phosphate transport system protein
MMGDRTAEPQRSPTVRAAFAEELESIVESMVAMCRLVGDAMEGATIAVLDADLQVAERVITSDETVDQLYHEVEERTLELLARQGPVATDLRLIVASLRIVADLERMGDLALHVAKVARRRYPASAIPPELRDTVREMGVAAKGIVAKAGDVIQARDVDLAAELERDDDVMDALHRTLFTIMLHESWGGGIETAIDIALVGRYYERYADHAVSVARRVVFLVTGERVGSAL